MRKLLPLLILLLSLVSCQKQEETVVFKAALAQEPPTLDVTVSSSISSRMIASGNIYEKLLTLEDGKLRPLLAESWEVSEDGKRAVFRLRGGVTFHDGSPMRPEDVSASLNRWLESYKPAGELLGESRFVPEDGEVRIESSGSLALLPLMLASSPQAAVVMPERVLGPLVTEYIGTGPYRFAGWKSGEGVRVESYDGYWGEKPQIEEISYLFVPDSVTRRLGLETGLYSAIDTVSNDDIPALSGNSKVTVLQGEESGSIALVLNRDAGPFQDVALRRALALLVDRENLMRACYGETGYSIHTDYMEESVWSVPDFLDMYGRKDGEEGRRLLDGFEGPVRILVSNLSGLDRIALALASELDEAGIEAEVTALDWVSFLERRKDTGVWDICISAYTRTALPTQKAYLKGYEELLRPVSSAASEEEAAGAWQEAQIALWDDVPVIIPGHYSTSYAVSSRVKGVRVSDGFYFDRAYVE